MGRRIESMPPIIADIVRVVDDPSQQEWTRENAALRLDEIAEVCSQTATRYRKGRDRRLARGKAARS